LQAPETRLCGRRDEVFHTYLVTMFRHKRCEIFLTSIIFLGGPVGCGGGLDAPFPDTGPVPVGCVYEPPVGPVFHVATHGSDDSGDGSEVEPWRSIGHALASVGDGSTILVQPGTYDGGPIRLEGWFERGVTVRSATLYAARLRTHSGATVFCYRCRGITLEGFDIAHARPGAGPLVVHLGGKEVERITIRNNIIHDSFNNDLLKINNGAEHITVERNIFYNQAGSDEHIDINSAADVLVQDNVFLNHFEAGGRSNYNDTSSYIVIKDSNGDGDGILGAQRVVVRRNVFLNWEGSHAANFVLVGEDGADYIEARDVLVENNLLIGNSENEIRAPFGVKSGYAVMFRNNTVAGDLPGASYAVRVNVENPKITNEGIDFYNNIWSDATGTMSEFSASPPEEIGSFTLDGNLYWNLGRSIPVDDRQSIRPELDLDAVHGDPLLGDQRDLVVPTWMDGSARFADGSSSTCAVFERLVALYGTAGGNSAALDAARVALGPDHDILGSPRDGTPDIGAVEH
jgi:hypothetical protein